MNQDFKIISERLKNDLGLNSFKELAEKLNIEHNRFRACRKQNTIPYFELLQFCDEQGLNHKWVLFGQGEMFISDIESENKRLKKEKIDLENKLGTSLDKLANLDDEGKKMVDRLLGGLDNG